MQINTDTTYDVIQDLMNMSEYGGFAGAGDVQRIEYLVAGWPNEAEYHDDHVMYLTGALAAICMVGPYTAEVGAETILATAR